MKILSFKRQPARFKGGYSWWVARVVTPTYDGELVASSLSGLCELLGEYGFSFFIGGRNE